MPRSDFAGLPPKPCVPLVGKDGNAWSIMGRVVNELERTGHAPEVVTAYTDEAMSSDYWHLLRVTLDYVDDSGTGGGEEP